MYHYRCVFSYCIPKKKRIYFGSKWTCKIPPAEAYKVPRQKEDPYPVGNVCTMGLTCHLLRRAPEHSHALLHRLRPQFFSSKPGPAVSRLPKRNCNVQVSVHGTHAVHVPCSRVCVLSLLEQHLVQATALSPARSFPSGPTCTDHSWWTSSSNHSGIDYICQQQPLHFSSRPGCRTCWTRWASPWARPQPHSAEEHNLI